MQRMRSRFLLSRLQARNARALSKNERQCPASAQEGTLPECTRVCRSQQYPLTNIRAKCFNAPSCQFSVQHLRKLKVVSLKGGKVKAMLNALDMCNQRNQYASQSRSGRHWHNHKLSLRLCSPLCSVSVTTFFLLFQHNHKSDSY